MKLIHLFTTYDCGAIEVGVRIVGGEFYTYRVNGEFAVRKFSALYRKGLHGRALQILKKFKI